MNQRERQYLQNVKKGILNEMKRKNGVQWVNISEVKELVDTLLSGQVPNHLARKW